MRPFSEIVFIVCVQEKFLQDRIKVDGKTGQLGDKVKLTREGDKLKVEAKLPFSKRYLKYLAKKYLKKQQLRDFMHIIASDKNTYKLKYFNMAATGAEEQVPTGN